MSNIDRIAMLDAQVTAIFNRLNQIDGYLSVFANLLLVNKRYLDTVLKATPNAPPTEEKKDEAKKEEVSEAPSTSPLA